MIQIINNALDILWLIIGLISIVVMIAILFPWGTFYGIVAMTLVVVWIMVKFWVLEGWYSIKRLFRKKHKLVDIDDHNLFI